jgi:hypothetical protein
MSIELIYGSALAAVFLVAFARKMMDRNGFADYLVRATTHFGVAVSPATARRVGAAVIVVELLLAALVVSPVPGRSFGAAGVLIFVIGATVFLGVQHAVGDASSCACFGPVDHARSILDQETARQTISRVLAGPWQAVRNSALACLALMILVEAREVSLPRSAILLAVIPALLVATSLAAAIAFERGFMKRDQHPRYSLFAPILAPLVILNYYKSNE